MTDDLPPSWRKMQVLSGLIASVFIPLAIAFIGHKVNQAIKQNKFGLHS